MLDARRMEVYCAIFDVLGNEITPTEAKIIDKNSFDTLLQNNTICFFGEGASKCKQIILHQNAFFLANVFPDAISLGKYAYQNFINQNYENLAYFEPYYLKEFVNNTKITP